MWSIGCPETSIRNYLYSLRNNTEERSSQLRACVRACVCAMEDSWNSEWNTLERDRPQHTHPAARVIAQH